MRYLEVYNSRGGLKQIEPPNSVEEKSSKSQTLRSFERPRMGANPKSKTVSKGGSRAERVCHTPNYREDETFI